MAKKKQRLQEDHRQLKLLLPKRKQKSTLLTKCSLFRKPGPHWMILPTLKVDR